MLYSRIAEFPYASAAGGGPRSNPDRYKPLLEHEAHANSPPSHGEPREH
jgi:hypothetical protein